MLHMRKFSFFNRTYHLCESYNVIPDPIHSWSLFICYAFFKESSFPNNTMYEMIIDHVLLHGRLVKYYYAVISDLNSSYGRIPTGLLSIPVFFYVDCQTYVYNVPYIKNMLTYLFAYERLSCPRKTHRNEKERRNVWCTNT